MNTWRALPWWVRVGAALGILLLSTILFATGYYGTWRISAIGWGIGLMLLFFAFPSGPEKKGYHDF
jgi:hypothetical protein